MLPPVCLGVRCGSWKHPKLPIFSFPVFLSTSVMNKLCSQIPSIAKTCLNLLKWHCLLFIVHLNAAMLLWAHSTQRRVYDTSRLNPLSVPETLAALCCFDIDYLTTLLLPPSCVPHPNGMSRRHDGEVWNLGHSRSGALPQFGAYVLQRSAGGYRGLRHHKRGTRASRLNGGVLFSAQTSSSSVRRSRSPAQRTGSRSYRDKLALI